MTVREASAANLRAERSRRRMTQKQLAEAIGVNVCTVSNWETGANVMGIDKALAICELFGISLDDLAGKE